MGSIDDVRAVCREVADDVPLGLVASARREVDTSLAHLMEAVGSSTNPLVRMAQLALKGMADDIEQARVHLEAATDRVLDYEARL